jgi:hypothetical protein
MNGFHLALRTYPTEDFFLLHGLNPGKIRKGDPELVVSTSDIVHHGNLAIKYLTVTDDLYLCVPN